MNYLLKRDSGYYYQRRVPKCLSNSTVARQLTSKKIFQTSLKTTSLREAKFQAAKINSWFESLLADINAETFDAGKYFYRLVHHDALSKEDARCMTIERIEEETGFSFSRDPEEALPEITAAAKHAINQLQAAESGRLSLSLQSIGNECIDDLMQEGSTNKKSIPGKIKPAIQWFLKSNELSDINLIDIKPSMVNRAMKFSARDLKLKASTVNGHINALRTVWKFARFNYDVDTDNPFTGARAKGKPESYQRFLPEEIAALYQLANPKIHLAIKIGATTGARLNEVLTMQVIRDEESNELYWSIKPDGDGKTLNSTRVIPVHPKLVPEIQEGFRLELSDRDLSRHMKAAVNEIKARNLVDPNGTGRLSFHSFRSHVASELLFTHGYKPEEVELYTGHRPQGSEIKRKRTVHTYIQCPSKDILRNMASNLCWPFEN